MEEIWKDVVGYEGLYQVSNYGRVYSVRNDIVLKPQRIYRTRNYLGVGLHNGKMNSRPNNNHGTRNKRISESERNSVKKKKCAVSQYTLDGEFVRSFPSATEASRFGFSKSHILDCAKGLSRYSHSQGYVWKFANDEDV